MTEHVTEEKLLELIRDLVATSRADATVHSRVYADTALKLCDACVYLMRKLEELKEAK